MRISDWSSDVCSSDLPPPEQPAETRRLIPCRLFLRRERQAEVCDEDRQGVQAAQLSVPIPVCRVPAKAARGSQAESGPLDPTNGHDLAQSTTPHLKGREHMSRCCLAGAEIDRKSTRLHSSH